MNQSKTIISAVFDFILGKKYYANIINTRGTSRQELSCFIFHSKQEAGAHKEQLSSNSSFAWVETVSFRSYNQY